MRNVTFIKGNITWLALNQVGGNISQQERELIMSLIGTVILTPPDDDGNGASPRYAEPTITGLRDLLLGRADSTTQGNVDVDVYVCDEPAECMNPVRTTVSVKPFTQLVAERLRRMSDNIVTRSAQSAADIGFINNTSEPVYRMLAVAMKPGASSKRLTAALEEKSKPSQWPTTSARSGSSAPSIPRRNLSRATATPSLSRMLKRLANRSRKRL